jgi:hypothetical protein
VKSNCDLQLAGMAFTNEVGVCIDAGVKILAINRLNAQAVMYGTEENRDLQ